MRLGIGRFREDPVVSTFYANSGDGSGTKSAHGFSLDA